METIAVCYEIHVKNINTLCEKNVELLNVKRGGTYSYHRAIKLKKIYGHFWFESRPGSLESWTPDYISNWAVK